MTSRDFCYWLQGFFEMTQHTENISLYPAQVDMIKRHLNMVFKHEIDPSMGNDEKQSALNALHVQQNYDLYATVQGTTIPHPFYC